MREITAKSIYEFFANSLGLAIDTDWRVKKLQEYLDESKQVGSQLLIDLQELSQMACDEINPSEDGMECNNCGATIQGYNLGHKSGCLVRKILDLKFDAPAEPSDEQKIQWLNELVQADKITYMVSIGGSAITLTPGFRFFLKKEPWENAWDERVADKVRDGVSATHLRMLREEYRAGFEAGRRKI